MRGIALLLVPCLVLVVLVARSAKEQTKAQPPTPHLDRIHHDVSRSGAPLEARSDERVRLLIAPDGHGGSITYTGKEAEQIYYAPHPTDRDFASLINTDPDIEAPTELD